MIQCLIGLLIHLLFPFPPFYLISNTKVYFVEREGWWCFSLRGGGVRTDIHLQAMVYELRKVTGQFLQQTFLNYNQLFEFREYLLAYQYFTY